MTNLPEVLLCGTANSSLATVIEGLKSKCQVTPLADLGGVVAQMREAEGRSCLLTPDVAHPGLLLELGGLLENFPEAVFILTPEGDIVWGNALAKTQLHLDENPPNGSPIRLFDAWHDAEIVGPDFCPLHTVLATGEPTETTIHVDDKTYFSMTVNILGAGRDKYLLAILRDTSARTIEQEKLNAIYQAGLELGDMQPDEILDLDTEERIELLKSRILHYTQDLLNFETVEVRLVDHQTKELRPLLAHGMQPSAEQRKLFAEAEQHGVTGFVAATGRSYLCEDTKVDPLYLEGAAGARSSLTVPLILHEQVLGTFNVESPETGAFSQTDLQFLELFCREVAVAINTLDLLMAEKSSVTVEYSNRMLCNLADPLDEILNDAAWIKDRCKDAGPELLERIGHVLEQTQMIRQRIQQGGECDTDSVRGADSESDARQLRSKRILVVSADHDTRQSAHAVLGKLGCIVETAHGGDEALLMARTFHYDFAICDTSFPDMGGTELYTKLKNYGKTRHILLMQGFGYDQNHTIPNCRQMGLRYTLYKPFIPKQVVEYLTKSLNGE